jgi:hypothetical protein
LVYIYFLYIKNPCNAKENQQAGLKISEKPSYTFAITTLEVGEKQRRKAEARSVHEMTNACKRIEYMKPK